MGVSGRGYVVSPVLAAAVGAGLDAMGVEDVEVIVTADFNQTVRELTGSQNYTASRGTGGIAAKTVRWENDVRVLVNAALLEETDPTRLLAHEAGHVQITRRGETNENLQRFFPSQRSYTLSCIGAAALIEARIERSVVGLGFAPERWVEPFELGLALRSAHGEFAAATRSGDMTGVEPAFDRITKMLGYLAGAVIAGHQLQLAELSPDEVSIWGDYIASTWEARLDMYRSLPAATEATKSDWLWDFVICGELEGALLSTIGFTMDDAGQVDRRK